MLTGKPVGTNRRSAEETHEHFIQFHGQLLCNLGCPTDASEGDELFSGSRARCSDRSS